METETLADWQVVFRTGFGRTLPTAALEALRDGLWADDPAVRTGCTVFPGNAHEGAGVPCEGAEPVAYGLWKGLGLTTCGEVHRHWLAAVKAAEDLSTVPVGVLLEWFDCTLRVLMVAQLFHEVELVLAARAKAEAEHGG